MSVSASARDHRPALRRDAIALAASFGLVVLVAGLGSGVTGTGPGTWYASLEKPAWTPPGAFIGIVWTFLYALMAVAAWLVWRTRDPRRALALGLYGAQLALNAAWSWLFFGLERPWLAFADIALLAALVLATLVAFARVSRVAAALLAPYLAWVFVAGTLNLLIALANP
ncbi:MAG TPA: TspO/MBR family protein [Candidatus Thermoplasmatota archaeon]|nr:TspO/MBR family protein [Candidatus Thermoplasmatota archaeon]